DRSEHARLMPRDRQPESARLLGQAEVPLAPYVDINLYEVEAAFLEVASELSALVASSRAEELWHLIGDARFTVDPPAADCEQPRTNQPAGVDQRLPLTMSVEIR